MSGNKRTIERVCELCGASFLARALEVKRGGARFCSRTCGGRGKAARARTSIIDRFWTRVGVPAYGASCWVWQGGIDKHGYGRLGATPIGTLAHRVGFQLLRGPIAEELQLDHLCRNRRCVNPDHLEPVTDRVNILRGFGMGARFARRTHCEKHGDELTPVKRGGQPYRICKSCQREWSSAKRARRKLATYQGSPVPVDAALAEYGRLFREVERRSLAGWGETVEALS